MATLPPIKCGSLQDNKTTRPPPVHPNNRYHSPHDFPALAKVVPALADYFLKAPDGHLTLNFAEPDAVRLLNKALLLRDYGLKHWDIPAGNLCPGVPGRLDYIHVLADLLDGKKGKEIKGLDVGTGASLIYPILGHKEFGWRFVGTDVDDTSLKVASAIAKFNPGLAKAISLRKQPDRTAIFNNVIHEGETFDFTICNPPFFESAAAAAAAAEKKWTKLGKAPSPTLNFGGQANELWAPGGEPDFLRRMIRESVAFGQQVGWFTTLVSKKGYLKIAEVEFGKAGITDYRVIGIGQGGKIRRVLAWRGK